MKEVFIVRQVYTYDEGTKHERKVSFNRGIAINSAEAARIRNEIRKMYPDDKVEFDTLKITTGEVTEF